MDHVLIGPAGVFTLNTKNHSNQPVWVAGRTLMVAGKKKRHIPNAVHEAARAARLLTTAAGEEVAVMGVLVIVEPKSITAREKPVDVAVVTDRQLLRWLNRRRPVLTPEQVSRIATSAVLPGTSHRNPLYPAGLQNRFDALWRHVDVARRRRTAWNLAFAAGFVAAGAVLQTLIP
nr:nuclease-related domain-containing protein [Pseudarthrobacter sp. NBSH8]